MEDIFSKDNSSTQTPVETPVAKPASVVPPAAPPTPPAPPKSPKASSTEKPKKKSGGHHGIMITIMFIIGLLLGGGAVFVYYQFVVNPDVDQEIANIKTELDETVTAMKAAEGESMTAKKQVEQLSCDGTWTEEDGCVPFEFQIVQPDSSSKLCTGEENIFEILAPTSIDSVRISLNTQSSSNDLGDFVIASSGNTPVQINWNGLNSFHIAPKEGQYKLSVRSATGQEVESPYFELENCGFTDNGGVMVNDGSSDDDQDGLTYNEEIMYGTNPNIADSDADGYSDGDEVKNGFNPNGDGPLPTCPGPDCDIDLVIPF